MKKIIIIFLLVIIISVSLFFTKGEKGGDKKNINNNPASVVVKKNEENNINENFVREKFFEKVVFRKNGVECNICGINTINRIENNEDFWKIYFEDGHSEKSILFSEDDYKFYNEKTELNIKEKEFLKMSVKIPKLKFSEEKYFFEFSEYEVKKSRAVLSATLKKLFDLRSQNSGVWNGLSFDSVSLNNGKAKIKLEGRWFPLGDMSGLYFKEEIEVAIFQFNTVESLEIFIEGERFDWCIDDMSDSEGGCNESPKFWLEKKLNVN